MKSLRRSYGPHWVMFVLLVACGSSDITLTDTNGDASILKEAGKGQEPVDDGTNPIGSDGGEDGSAPASEAIHFIALGDTGKGNASQREVAGAVEEKCKKSTCDFAVLLGDNIYDSGASSPNDRQFSTKFEVPYANINIDFFAVLGNHDYGSGGLGLETNKAQNEIAYTKISKKWKMPAAYYRLGKKNVDFFATDTQLQVLNQAAQQKTDLGNWITASNAKWKIALGHHPYKSNGPHGNAGSYDTIPLSGNGVKTFMDDVVCGKADLYLSGHDHSRQWITDKCGGKTELIVNGTGAEGTSLPGSNATYFQSTGLGFIYFTVDQSSLTAEFIDVTGKVEFTRTIKK